MTGPIALLVVVTLSIVITRVAAIALSHTGVSRELAQFQARSALTGAGFTTDESERVVNHPVRRRIILWLMFLGNAGVVTGMASIILTFVGDENEGFPLWAKLAAMIIGLSGLWVFAHSEWVDRHLSDLVDRLINRYTDLNVRDYANLMHLTGEYRLVELKIREGDWMDGTPLEQSRLRREGILVLAIDQPDGSFIGAPQPEDVIHAGDRLILYGRVGAIEALDERPRGGSGEQDHRREVERQKQAVAAEREGDPEQPQPPEPER